MCYGCVRPTSHCVCNLIAPFQAHCNLLVLQHPHERKKYYSTVKLLRRAVTNVKLLRGCVFEAGEIERAIGDHQPYILYPSRDATPCDSLQLHSSHVAIVVDGTWDEAGKIMFHNPILHRIPRITFAAPLESNYRIRKQPRKHYLSTIESVAYLLKFSARASGVEEKCTEYDTLLSGFSKMVEQQLSYFPRGVFDVAADHA